MYAAFSRDSRTKSIEHYSQADDLAAVRDGLRVLLDDYIRAPPGESSGKPEPARAPSPATTAERKSNAEIATVLFLSPKTVDTYRSRMMHKLGSGDLPHLVRFAIQHGVTQLD
jgi:hypothetical protein